MGLCLDLGQLLIENFLSVSLGSVAIAIFFLWLGWVANHRPKCKECKNISSYIDDAHLTKMDQFECTFDWGTKLFPYKKCKLMDVHVSCHPVIRYVPTGGIETELELKYFETRTVKDKSIKPLKLLNRNFFNEEIGVNKVKVIVQTPIDRAEYASKIKQKYTGNDLEIQNENSEEIREYTLLLKKPVKIGNIKVKQGNITSIQVEIAYPPLNSVLGKQFKSIEEDVVTSLIMDLPPNNTKGNKIVVQIG